MILLQNLKNPIDGILRICNIIKKPISNANLKPKEDMMRGGKRPGAGRRPRFGAYHQTTTMRVPAALKQEIIAHIERLCVDGESQDVKTVTKSKRVAPASQTENVTVSKDELSAALALLNDALHLKANAGGAIKHEIRKSLKILQF